MRFQVFVDPKSYLRTVQSHKNKNQISELDYLVHIFESESGIRGQKIMDIPRIIFLDQKIPTK